MPSLLRPLLARPLLALATVVALTSCINVGRAVVTHRVYGTVVDAATHQPIPNARVALQDYPKIATATSTDGAFNIPSQHVLKVQLPIQANHHADQPTIVVTAPGYHPATVDSFNDRHEIALLRE